MNIAIPQLPLAFMNEDHAHAKEILQDMTAAIEASPVDRDRLRQACQAFLQHNREHFAREEEAMRNSGFPPYPVHKGEHDKALLWLSGLCDAARESDDLTEVAQTILQELPVWFVQHIQSMDLVTARWVSAHGQNAAPGAASPDAPTP